MVHSSRTLDILSASLRDNRGVPRHPRARIRMEKSEVRTTREAAFLSQLDLIERVTAHICQRNRLNTAEADDFASHVKLKVVEHDYAILGKFEGRSSLQTYLTVVIQRLFLDYRI